MNTPAHLIFGAAAFGRPHRPGTTLAAVAGSLVPDLSLYLLSAGAIVILGQSPRVVFGEYYFSDLWQGIFAVDNSLVLWGGLLAAALALRRPLATAFAAGGVLHLILDFALHHDDARRHFWPLTDWVFRSPVSYWDPRHHGAVAGAVEIGACVLLTALLIRRHVAPGWRIAFAALMAAELAPLVMWAMIF